MLLLQYLDRGDGPLVFGIRAFTNQETLERRRALKSNPWAFIAMRCLPAPATWCPFVVQRFCPIVKGGGKVGHVGGSIVGLRLSTLRHWKTVPSAAFYKVDYQPLEGKMDVSSGDVRSGAESLHGGGDERSGSLPGVRSAPGHGAQDAGLITSKIDS